MEADLQRQHKAAQAEREPGTVAFALAAFRRRRGFERSGLVAWLHMSPTQFVSLALERQPDRSGSELDVAVAEIAARTGADPIRLAEALAG